jgi:hypothetical protein
MSSSSSDFTNGREEEQEEEFLDDEEEKEVGFEELVGTKGANDRTGDSFKEEEDEEAARDKKVDFLQQLHPNIKEKLAGNVWGITNLEPLRFIIAHKDYNRIIRATTHKRKKLVQDNKGDFDENRYEIIPYLKPRDIIFNAIPREIISHENPLGFIEHKFTIRFTTNTGRNMSIGPRTIEEIVAELRERALVCTSRSAGEALSIIINAFINDNKVKINDEIEASGFYYINGKLRSYHINHPRPSKKQIQQCAELLDILVTKYRRKEIIPTIIKWGIIAPFNYAIKQYTDDGQWLPWLYPYGWTRTGKTTIGKIVNGIWGKYSDRKHRIPFTSINSDAKFGFILSQTTYPITINEVGALSDERHKVMLEMVKNSIESRVARSKHVNKTIYTDIPALCACVLTSNPQPPKDPGFRSKIIPIVFTKEDRHSPEEKAAFDLLMSQRAAQLEALGEFSADYIMKNQHVLLKKNKEECNWKETAKVIITEFYKTGGGLDAPYWIDHFLEEELHIVDDSADDVRLLVRAFFINLINDTYNKYARIYDDTQGMEKTFHMRFNFCCEKELIPSTSLIHGGQTIVIFSDIMKELRNPKSGIDASEVASLQELANTVGLEYGQKWLNGKNTKVAYGDMAKFIRFLDSEIEDKENPEQSETTSAQAV